MHPILFYLPLPEFHLPVAWIPIIFALLFSLAAMRKLFGKNKNYREAIIAGIFATLCLLVRFTIMARITKTLALGNFPMPSYGSMLLLSFIVGWFLTSYLAERDGLSKSMVVNNFFCTAIAAMVGARLLFILTNLHQFHTLSSIFVRGNGLVAYGGFLGGFLGSFLFLRYHRLPLLPWADVVVPSLASGLMITRIGCYLFGCDFGMPLSEHAPAFLQKLGTFPHWPAELALGPGAPAWLQHVQERGLPLTAEHSLPVHPTQLYESLVGAGLLLILLVARRHQKFSGQIFFLFAFAYGVARYILEIIRDDAERGSIPPAIPEQLLHPLVLVLLAIAYAIGISNMIERRSVRTLTCILALSPACIAYFALAQGSVQLSTSQLIALLSALASAWAFRMIGKRARPKDSI